MAVHPVSDDDKMLDDSETRFALLEIDKGKPNLSEPISLAKERELRQLRQRCADLTEALSERDKTLVAQIQSREWHEEEHHKCGFHPAVDVSMETNSVTCRVCGAELAPLDVLREIAQGERRFVQNINGLRKEKGELSKEIESLKRQLSTLKSKVRRSAGYDPADHKGEVARYTARGYYELLAKNEHLTAKLKAAGIAP